MSDSEKGSLQAISGVSHTERALFALERRLNCTWSNLREADTAYLVAKEDLISALQSSVPKFSTEDANVVVFGSMARREWIPGVSDLDWTYFIDGQANSAHLKLAQQIRATLEKVKFGEPGPTGTFGSLAFSHQLVHLIGGQDDTNKNMTQRILLLLESVPIGARSAYDRVARAVIDRYLEEEAQLLVQDYSHFKVPRFLLNDIVRFWRTMAVDFASKQRDRGGRGWGLRNAKLRLSRKLIFASGLLICFDCTLDQGLQQKISTESRDISLKHLANHIWEYVNSTPLDIVASLVQKFEVPEESCRQIFSAYDAFMGLVSDRESRAELNALSSRDSRNSKVFARIREISRDFEMGLNAVFFGNQLRLLTEKYGVF